MYFFLALYLTLCAPSVHASTDVTKTEHANPTTPLKNPTTNNAVAPLEPTADQSKDTQRRRRRNSEPEDPLKKRVASILLSETFINEQIAKHLASSQLIKNLKIDFDPEEDKLYARGLLQIPIDDHQALGIDPSITQFKFQLTIKPRIGKRGHLILEFPLQETFFYQASSKNPERDRVMIPVQLVSLGLAATRGYLAALSGDFSSFERKTAKINALLKGVKRNLSEEKNADAIAVLKSEKRSLELQLESNSLQREQFTRTSKTLSNIMGFAGDDFNLNNEIRARDNRIMLKMKLERIVPYLKQIDLGGIRIQHNKRDGGGEDYFVLDVHSKLATAQPPTERKPRTPRVGLKVAPSILIRLNQDIFNSQAVVDVQKQKVGDQLKDFDVVFKEDGIHVTGKIKKWFFTVPFDSIVDFVSTGPDVFEVRLRELSVFGIGLTFLTKFALNAVKDKLDSVLHGICTYEYIGDKEGSKALKVTVKSSELIPAFPNLHLVDIDVRDRSFMLRIGRTETEIAKKQETL